MKEVELKRYAGPYEEIPFEYFIQSPIGLVPKDNGKKTRLIFHLSYPRSGEKVSVNSGTPQELKSVQYASFDEAVKLCIIAGKACFAGKSDMSAAFRHFAIKKNFWKFLVMKAQHPTSNKVYYFVDKCMPFGAAISCSNFQRFSDAISHIVKVKTKGHENVNYLDDFFFVALIKSVCDQDIQTFLDICQRIKFPVSMEKTEWGMQLITFLGLLIDTVNQIISIPPLKINKAVQQIDSLLTKSKTTLRVMQQLTGLLNFLGKAIVPGRAFTRRLYGHTAGLTKKNHHLNLTLEIKADLTMWRTFLLTPAVFCRKFIDLTNQYTSEEIDWYTDASANYELGCGGYSGRDWFIMQWEEKFMKKHSPSINYLELYAVAVAIYSWIYKYKNMNIVIFCDNMSVVHMINTSSSKCKNCMVLLRLIVLK